MEIPIIKPHEDQRLIIDFVKNENGADEIKFSFEPDFSEPSTPAQYAAVNVARHIIQQFAINNKGTENDTEH